LTKTDLCFYVTAKLIDIDPQQKKIWCIEIQQEQHTNTCKQTIYFLTNFFFLSLIV